MLSRPDAVIVKVKAASVNPIDTRMAGKYLTGICVSVCDTCVALLLVTDSLSSQAVS